MKRLKKLFDWELTLWFGSVGILFGLFLYYVTPDYYFPEYPTIPVFYYVLGLFTVNTLEHSKPSSEISIVNRYMLMRGLKMVLTLLFVGCSLFFMKQKRMCFLLTVMVYYFIYLIMETYFFYRYEKRLKNKEDI